jgi:membrane protein implicated in regulation of membrane protease activity
MYRLARLLLMLTVAAALVFLFFAIALGWPTTAWVVLVVFLAKVSRRAVRRFTSLGSARWADEGDLRRKGMLDANSGLIIGRLIES